MKAVVFVGPSVSVADARTVLEAASYLPPVQMGDVYRVACERPDVICVLDGVFERVPAVWHKEILFALSRGVRVVGAASMGALRAAELHSFGMEGIGRIFEAFRDGALEGDDEVTLIHASRDDGYRALSEPLVNVRLGLARAVDAGLLAEATARAAVDAMKARFYAERSWPATYAAMQCAGASSSDVALVRTFINGQRPNAKRDDALEALRYVRDTADLCAPAARDWVFEPTELWCQLVATRESSDGHAALRDVRTHALLFADNAEELARGALFHALVEDAARRLQLEVTPERATAVARELRLAHGLASAEALREWMATHDLSTQGFAAIVAHEAKVRELERVHRANLDDGIIAELRRRGAYRAMADGCASILRGGGGRDAEAASPSLTEVGVSAEALAEWYRGETGRARWDHRLVHSSDAQAHVLRAFVASRDRRTPT